MISKSEEVFDSHDRPIVFWVFFSYHNQHIDLCLCHLIALGLVSNDFYCNTLFFYVIKALKNCSKCAHTEYV
jgi:hypothetical protein